MNNLNLDLDLSNYSIDDLKNFLNIDALTFDYADLQRSVKKKVAQIMGIRNCSDIEKKNIINFVNQVNLKLVEQIKLENKIAEFHRNPSLEIKDPTTNYEFPPYKKESSNQYETKKIITHLSIDTKFRKNYLFSKSTDFYIDLPVSLKNILSMRLESFEINNSIYNISSKKKTNKIYVKKERGFDIFEKTIIIPDGNYTATSLKSYLNSELSSVGVKIEFNENTLKSKLIADENNSKLWISFDYDMKCGASNIEKSQKQFEKSLERNLNPRIQNPNNPFCGELPLSFYPSNKICVINRDNSIKVILPSDANLLAGYNYKSIGAYKGIYNSFQITFASPLNETKFNAANKINHSIDSISIISKLNTPTSGGAQIADSNQKIDLIAGSIETPQSDKILLEAGNTYEILSNYDNLPDIISVKFNLVNSDGGAILISDTDNVVNLDNGNGIFMKSTNEVVIECPTESKITPDTSKLDQRISPTSLGWLLGFRKENYEGTYFYESETFYDFNIVKYMFLCVDDFQKSMHEVVKIVYQDSFLQKNILARIPMSVSSNNKLFIYHDMNNVQRRNYFGPVNIKRMRIQLIDEYGELVDLNDSDFSFNLEFEVLYERNIY
jgi:hypothetical protein